MITFHFDNSYARLSPLTFSRVRAKSFSQPRLLAFNQELFHQLGAKGLEQTDELELANIFSGQTQLIGSDPIAQVYAGHQFGHFNPQLGDGRALLLGEILTPEGKRFDLQLKGSGPTPYSRRGDGLSSIGPVIREYLVSEAMFYLGVPTTRALAAVWSGEKVYRQFGEEPGGVFTRVAQSHLRIGSFQYFLGTGDHTTLKNLLHYAMERHYPEALQDYNPYLCFFSLVAERLNQLVCQWMSLGFIHGVMNTDNTSISAETLDFGPCAFLDHFKSSKHFSFVDREGRYRYENQTAIIQWNLARFAECLIPFVDTDQNKSIQQLTQKLEQSKLAINQLWHDTMARKLGIINPLPDDSSIVRHWFSYLEGQQLDFTLSFRQLLSGLEIDDQSAFRQDQAWSDFSRPWQTRLEQNDRTQSLAQMRQFNPCFIPRNHLVERAIQEAMNGEELNTFRRILNVSKSPFEIIEGEDDMYLPPKPCDEVKVTYCGT